MVPRAFSRDGLATPNRAPHVALAGLGGAMLYRAISGFCPIYHFLGLADREHAAIGVAAGQGAKCEETVEVDGPPSEVFAFWRQLSNLPMLFSHLESVVESEGRRSHWTAIGPLNRRVEWDAEIINEIPNELLAWRTLEHADVVSAGSVRFRPADNGHGTEVRVRLQYGPPAGRVGAAVAWLLGNDPAAQIREDLRHFKQLLETGEIATTKGQPRGER